MTLTGTGPLVALVDTGDDYNVSCEAQLRALSLPLALAFHRGHAPADGIHRWTLRMLPWLPPLKC